MKAFTKSLLTSVCLLLTPPVLAAHRTPSTASRARPGIAVASMMPVDHYARRCQGQSPQRGTHVQGTLLWGTKQTWDPEQQADEQRSVLTVIDSDVLRVAPVGVSGVRLEEGRLTALPDASRGIVGTVLQGTDSEGNPVEVAICAAEPTDDPSVEWYRIEAWNPMAQEWENPCQGDRLVPVPRALPVGGTWDSSGAHWNAPGKLTLACETGVISKCAAWGYKPWAERDGKSLADLHQACTRMARADYCGNGQSHTLDGTVVDAYDSFGLQSRVMQATASWDPALASFEAAWAPDGATCLARTRYGQSLESILRECPGRFHKGPPVDFGGEDRCSVQRDDVSPEMVLLRNRSYDGR
ncbi:hypothetical protein JY651_46885 [Pyxidicoccus parkwayensis]|uniref:ADYC domain-containing protein n=1 Tax=Pyxidicoccus parkwayensis TaxID=2813578 RepID=A0ABX7NUI2_9BACT|nr:ADYC domain-containing protein [Pyxidicoccus parkwaysis]QSQ22560.1 hypothetical protein JY651_46885 [Pyxidicoccus parkwaysis]